MLHNDDQDNVKILEVQSKIVATNEIMHYFAITIQSRKKQNTYILYGPEALNGSNAVLEHLKQEFESSSKIYIKTNTHRKIIFYDNFVSFWTCHSKHLCQHGHVIPNIHVTLDHFPVTLDISCHFGQCHKRPCFLLVKVNHCSYKSRHVLHCQIGA